MTAGYLDATDEMNAVVAETVSGAVSSIVGYEPKIYWQGIGSNDKLDQSKLSIAVRRNTLGSDQGTLSNCVGRPGQRRFNSWGVIVVQLYAPTTKTSDFRMAGKCGEALQKALRRRVTDSVVRFSDVRIDDGIGMDKGFNRLNVVATFEYDEIQ